MEARKDSFNWPAYLAGVAIATIIWHFLRPEPAKVLAVRVISVLAGVVAARGTLYLLRARAARKKGTELGQGAR